MWKAIVIAVAVILAQACSGPHEGTAQVIAEISSADVTQVNLTITGAGIATPITATLNHSGNTWTGTITHIPAGTDRLFQASAVDANNQVLYSGSAHVPIVANQEAVVMLVLQQANPPPPFGNSAPVIDSIVLSSAVVTPSGTLSATVSAHDADGDALTYGWSATAGAFNPTNTANVVWTAPATEGPQSLTIQVSDPSGAKATKTLTIQVASSAAYGSASVTVTVNTWPIVSDVNATPTSIDVGESTTLTVAATDADADALSYSWSASCNGTFNDTTAASPVFTLSTVPAGQSCTLTVVASDGRGGQDTGALTIHAGPGAVTIIAPQIDSTFQSQATVGGSETLTFGVTAHDPQSQALTFTWSSNTGTFGTQNDTAGSSQVSWTSAACTSTPVAPVITVTISDTSNASTTQTFAVTSTCASCSDGIKNSQETDIDCGGPVCGDCAIGKACLLGTDCSSSVCAAGICQPATCNDGVKNGNETGIDCGGGTCAACPAGEGCSSGTDCQTTICTNNICSSASCADGVKDGSETDVDCGGASCAACANGAACIAGTDCQSSVCVSNVCARRAAMTASRTAPKRMSTAVAAVPPARSARAASLRRIARRDRMTRSRVRITSAHSAAARTATSTATQTSRMVARRRRLLRTAAPAATRARRTKSA